MARMFNRDILPAVGRTPLQDLSESSLRALLRKVIGACTVSKAAHMLLGIKQMLAWVEKRRPWRSLLGSKVRRHYLHHDYAEEKAEAWRTLGGRLDEILTKPNKSIAIT